MDPMTSAASVPPLPKPDRILRRREVEHRVGLSRSAIYRRMARGQFPRALDLGGNIVGWRESALDSYVASLPERNA